MQQGAGHGGLGLPLGRFLATSHGNRLPPIDTMFPLGAGWMGNRWSLTRVGWGGINLQNNTLLESLEGLLIGPGLYWNLLIGPGRGARGQGRGSEQATPRGLPLITEIHACTHTPTTVGVLGVLRWKGNPSRVVPTVPGAGAGTQPLG